MALVACGLALAAAFGARAYAQNFSTCSGILRPMPANGQSETIQAICQHESAGRGASNATFVAQRQNNVRTLSVSMSCCTGMNAMIRGLDAGANPIPGCVAIASPGSPASVTCNSAFSWDGGLTYIE